jgi:hypothetical protein
MGQHVRVPLDTCVETWEVVGGAARIGERRGGGGGQGERHHCSVRMGAASKGRVKSFALAWFPWQQTWKPKP